MRGYVILAAGLFVTNLVVVQRSKPRVEIDDVAVKRFPTLGETDAAKRLRWFWQAKHNALRLPECRHHDPLATLDADVDPTPGRERLVGNRRFGVMMFDEQGTFLAHMEPIGCGERHDGDQSLSISFDNRLVLHTRNLTRQGEYLEAAIVERRLDELVTLLAVPAGGHHTEFAVESDVEARIVSRSDEVEVIYHGRKRSMGSTTWEAVDDHCTWQLSTRTSSCRTRAGEQTPGSE